MKVALVEVCEPGHYMIIHGLIQTYSIDPNAEISIFVSEDTWAKLEINEYPTRLKINTFVPGSDMSSFLNKIKHENHERVHLCTVNRYFIEFYNLVNFRNLEVFFHFHNIDLWFFNPLKIYFRRFVERMFQKESFGVLFNYAKYSFNRIKEHPKRKKFIKSLIANDAYYITLGEAQKDVLNKLIPNGNFITFPSIINETVSAPQEKSRPFLVSIPGSVTQTKRDYLSLMESIISNSHIYRGKVIFELLGQYNGKHHYLNTVIQGAKAKGVKIITYEDYISPSEYDIRLQEADIFLANVIVSKSKYGQLKETGTVYNMIRGARPGLFPCEFTLDSDIASACKFFKDYDDLADIIGELSENKDILKSLTDNIKLVATNCQPKRLISRLRVGVYVK